TMTRIRAKFPKIVIVCEISKRFRQNAETAKGVVAVLRMKAAATQPKWRFASVNAPSGIVKIQFRKPVAKPAGITKMAAVRQHNVSALLRIR
ncbi:MAG: hypothetical protein ACK58T_25930, partial [Phycisphaerae bacterium]